MAKISWQTRGIGLIAYLCDFEDLFCLCISSRRLDKLSEIGLIFGSVACFAITRRSSWDLSDADFNWRYTFKEIKSVDEMIRYSPLRPGLLFKISIESDAGPFKRYLQKG